MYRYKIGICGGDFHYNVRLMEYLNCHEEIPLKVAVFSTEEAVEEYIQSNNLDMLLLSGEKSVRDGCIPMTSLLEQKSNKDGIYKYQSADAIGRSIMDRLGRKKTGKASWICIYSPVGRCGKTTLARKICAYLTGSLYVDLEDYISFEPNGAELKDGELFLYYLASENDAVFQLLERLSLSNKNSDGYVRLAGTPVYFDRQVNVKMLSWLKEHMLQENIFGHVVWDFGTATLTSIQMLDIFDAVIVPYKGDAAGMCKLNSFRSYVKERMGKELWQKIKYIEMTEGDIGTEDIEALL
ncbi:MAG: ATP-binding protein [Clostridium sp.]|nr:ATP-binding protein [Clostridium sp.]MCM1398635.1 ATP-binding protein [Clostridium sp.]MCM1459921.1 ATP-binding protein [Bacteroides sp.]